MILQEKLRPYRLLLASHSPRRQQLLRDCGLDYTLIDRYEVEERYPAGLPPHDVPLFLSQLKSDAYPEPVSCFPMNLIAKTSSSIAGTADGPLSLTARESKSGFATGREGKGSTANTHHGKLNTDRFELSSTPFSENDAAASLRAGDEVTFIVVLKSASLLGNYSVREISERTEAVKSQESKQIKAIDSAKKQAAEALGKSKHEFGFDYTVAMTGFSVTTAYGNRKKLEALNGVESVYVAPTFALPETDYDLAPLTNNSSTMIGSDILNNSGYGGKGMRIAILDTGILVTHPNFAALPDDKLDDPITRQSVDDIWYTLNAGKSTGAFASLTK